MAKEARIKITYGDGKTESISLNEAIDRGITSLDPEKSTEYFSYTDDQGTTKFSQDSSVLPASMTIDPETGNIKITAPKEVTDLPEFKRIFDEDALKQYSQAYKLNPDYKVMVTEYDDDGKEKGQKEVTIPEWVESKNEALKTFMEQLNLANDIKRKLASEYGSRVNDLSLTEIVMTQQFGDYTYLPESLKHTQSFGNGIKNPFLELFDKVTEDGKISAEEIKKVYTLSNFGREELANLMAHLTGHIGGNSRTGTYRNEFGEDYVDEEGNVTKNLNSKEEFVKTVAFKNFILSHVPEGEWYERVGRDIETLSLSALYGANRVFFNIANDVEWAITFGQGHGMQNYIKDVDNTMEWYVQTKSLESEATQTLYMIGMIGGTIAGTLMVNKLTGELGKDLGRVAGKTYNNVMSANLLKAAGIQAGTAAAEALSFASMASLIADNAENISTGVKFLMNIASVEQKLSLATNVYKTYMKAHKLANYASEAFGYAVSFLMDTIHDAFVYDSTTLRDALESADGDTRDFWMGQLADNAKWWGGMAGIKTSFKIAGKTTLGKALNVVGTKLINKVAAKIGKVKTKFKDAVHGGDVIRKLEGKIEDAVRNNKLKTANRLKRKLETEWWDANLRQAREQLGKLKLDWSGLKLTDDSLKDYQNAMSRIRALELGIDRYRNSIEYKRQEMVGTQIDPSTGKATFINKSLGESNMVASEQYWELAQLAKKYNLELARDSMISQEMLDYWTSKYYEGLAKSFAKNSTEAGARAKEALPIIQKNAEDAAAKLPEEIVLAIDKLIKSKKYQNFYMELNEYGMSKGLLNRAKYQSYQENPIWVENGYMPIVTEWPDAKGRYINFEGRMDAKIADEMENIEFKVVPGQHYQDPELVRQSRISGIAQMEINSQMFKAYGSFGSDATNIVRVSGEETEYVRILNENRKATSKAVEDSAKSLGEKLKTSEFDIKKVRRRRPIKNTTVPESSRVEIVNSMSPETVNSFLVEKGKIEEGKTVASAVNSDNYMDWYKGQSPAVKKYLTQQYQTYNPEAYTAKYTTKDIREGKADADVRTNLAQAVVDESNGEKLVLWRTQSTGVDDFYGSAGGTGASSAEALAKWEGGRWASIGGEPWSIGGYGDQKLAFPVKKADILDRSAVNDIKETANEIYQLKYGNATQKKIYQETWQTLENMGRKLEDEPYYEALSKLKKSQLKKAADGDPRVLLDLSDKKIIQYDTGTAGKEYVLFPDRNPELFKEGVEDMAEMSKIKSAGTYDDFKMASDAGGADFEDGLERAMLVGDKNFAKSSLMNEAKHNLDMGREAFYQGVLVADIKSKLRNVKRVDTTKLVDDVLPVFDDIIDSYVKIVLDDMAVKNSIAALAEGTEASAEFARYIALRQLLDTNMDTAYKAIGDEIEKELKALRDIDGNDSDNIRNQVNKLFKDKVETEVNDLSQIVRTSNPELIDTDDIYAKAKDLDEQIREIDPKKNPENRNTVMYLDNNGRQVFAEVDPAFASLYNYRFEIDRTEASALAKVNAMTSRWFRYGTTTVNLKSFGNQLFRDFGNALYVGGAWRTIKTYRKNLVDVFGDNIVDQIGRFDPTGYEMKQVKALASELGQTVEEAAVSRELMRGAANAPSTTEHTLYKKFMKEAYGDTNGKLTNLKNKLSDFVNEHKLNPEYWLNDKRENYLRNRVFAASYSDALEQGYDIEQARIFADFAMNNATTNFTRQLYHMQAISDSVPYFRAAINGSKSFWRMWSLDPVGISGRITGGLIIPIMYLTGASLGSEENRKVYENIPEYQKQDNLIFVVRGKIISAPLPQEIASLVAPYRQFVEYLYGSNKNDFWELMMNDALGFLPYDLQGFSTIDMDAMIQNPTIFDRMNRGVSRLFSQLAPIPLKTAYMIATGTDPYSGKSLKNPAYSYWNAETNSVETFDYNQNAFAEWFANLPFVKGWMTPELAEKIVSGVIGSTGSNLLGDIAAIFNPEYDAMESTVNNALESLTSPFTVPQYDLATAVWKRAVKELTAEKNTILRSDEMMTINKKLAQEKDPDERNDLFAKRRSLVEEYQQKVGEMVKRLEQNYGGTFGKSELAAVIQLLNFDTDPVYQTGSQYMSDLSTDIYYEGRDAAIQTMYALGINGVHDTSIFGYLTKDSKGNVVMRYNSPIAIMDMENTWGNQKNYHAANIRALINENDMWDKKKEVEAKVDAIYKKGNLSNADYDKINELYVDWNKEVMKVLAPYIQVMTPEAAINNTAVMDYLDGLIKVPSEFKKDRKGKYVTNSKLGTGSATDAYMKSYINYIFGVNDTGYSSGRNYSDRQTYDKENKRWTK